MADVKAGTSEGSAPKAQGPTFSGAREGVAGFTFVSFVSVSLGTQHRAGTRLALTAESPPWASAPVVPSAGDTPFPHLDH